MAQPATGGYANPTAPPSRTLAAAGSSNGSEASEAFGAAMRWFSVKADALAKEVEVAAASARQSALEIQCRTKCALGQSVADTPERPEVDEFEWLPPQDREKMLCLRRRAETRACDAPEGAVDSGLLRLRYWAEGVSWCVEHWPAEGTDRPAQWGDVSPRWKRLGFQSADPRRDLRVGILALDNLVYLCERRTADAERLCRESAADGLDYPLAVASINVTQMLAWYLSLVPGPNPAGPGSSITKLDDMMQIHAFARLCTAPSDAATSDVGQDGFGELHTATLVRLHLSWSRMKKADPSMNMSEIGGALHEALAVVDQVVRDSPLETVAELQRIRTATVSDAWRVATTPAG